MKRDNPTVVVAGVASTVSMLLTVGTALLSRTLDGVAAMVGLSVMVLLLLAPYMVAAQLSRGSPARRNFSRTAVSIYGLLDVALRVRVVWFPGSSTDAIALLTIPIIVGPLAFLAAFPALGLWSLLSWLTRRRPV